MKFSEAKSVRLMVFTTRSAIANLFLRSEHSCLAARCISSLVLLVVELTLLTIRFDTSSFEDLHHPLYDLLGYSGNLLRFVVGAAGAFLIFAMHRGKTMLFIFSTQSQSRNYWIWLSLHVFSTAIFYYLTWKLFEDIPYGPAPDILTLDLIAISWLGTFLIACSALLLTTSNETSWIKLIRNEYKIIGAALMIGVVVQVAGALSSKVWQSLTDITFAISGQLLGLFYQTIIVIPEKHILGAGDFKVVISPECSGYEGIGLIVTFLSLYIWIFRQTLRFPHVYLMFALGIVAIWTLNLVRIVALIAIGDLISPEIAIGGFHSNAGWITFVAISVILVFACQRMVFFNHLTHEASAVVNISSSRATSLLMPYVIMLGSILIIAAFTGPFDWLYPIKVMATGAVLWRFRSHYHPLLTTLTLYPLVIGTVVFLLWIVLVPISTNDDQQFESILFSQSSLIAYSWLFFRFFGAFLTVPIAEELAFRGYLIAKLVNSHFEQVPRGQFTWFSFIASSLLFGMLHGEWVAGFLAGLFYASALYIRKSIFDAIVAHMTTNLMLSVYIVISGHWSLW